SQGSVSSATANSVRRIRITMAAPEPQMIACVCCFGGSERAASAITTALSPDRMILTPMILKSPTQNSAETRYSSIIYSRTDRRPSVHQVDLACSRHLRQTRHGHDVAADHHHELGAGGESYFPDVDDMPGRRGAQLRIGRERVLGLRHAHRVMSVALVLQLLDLVAHLGVSRHRGGAIHLPGDLPHLVPERIV